MEKLKLYNVTKTSSDGNIQIGEKIWISENGDLNSTRAGGGCLSENEWNVTDANDFQVEECITHKLVIVHGTEMVVKM